VHRPDPELLRPHLYVPAAADRPLELDRLPTQPVLGTSEEALPTVQILIAARRLGDGSLIRRRRRR
jgi:hypothetical protein